MKKNLTVLSFGFFLFSIFVITSCENGVFCLKGKGDIVSENRQIDTFNKIHLIDSDASVWVKIGTEYSLEISAQENILDELITDVKNNILEIEYDHCVRKHDGIDIFITVPALEGVKVSSSGNMTLQTPVVADNFEIRLTGSGAIFTDTLIVAQKFEIDVTGSGNIECWNHSESTETEIILNSSGRVNLHNLKSRVVKASNSGSGQIYFNRSNSDYSIENSTETFELLNTSSGMINAYGQCAKNVEVWSHGSGQCFIYVFDLLNVHILGSGNITYKGTPTIIEDIEGSGKLINGN